MIKIEVKNRILHMLAKIVCGLLVVTALFLLGISLIFAISGGAPNIFGYNIYLVETDAFQLLHKGTAVFVVQEHMAEIVPGNIVIFDDGVNGPQLGEVQTNELSDGVYSFIALNEANTAVYLTQSQIVGKAMSYSDILGAVISFAVSPIGVFVIAIIPCIILIGIELFKIFNKSLPVPAVEPVNKQREVPTYVPRAKAVQSAEDDEPPSLDDSLESNLSEPRSYDAQRGAVDEPLTYSRPINRANTGAIPKPHSATATIPRQQSATETIPKPHSATGVIPQTHSQNVASPLFLGPNKQPQRRTDTARMPLSQKALNEAIAASRAERENASLRNERTAAVKEIQKSRTSVLERERREEEERRRIIAEKTAVAERTAQLERTARSERTAQLNTQKSAAPKFTPTSRTPAPKQVLSSTREIPRPVAESAEDIVQQYTPQRRGTATRATTSLPRLDALLNDESENEDKRYNIDDILASLDKNA